MPQHADAAWPELLERACAGGMVTFVFEPVVDLARGVPCGYVAHPRFPPAVATAEAWQAAARARGYASRLQAAVLSAAIARRGDLPPNHFLWVTAGAADLLSAEVGAVVAAAGDLSRLVVSLGERDGSGDEPALVEMLGRVQEHGGMCAIERVGAGHADLRHLVSLSPQFVRLDPGLVTDVDRDPRRAAAISAVGALAGELDAWLVGGGVARHAELTRLHSLGVPLAQGPLLGEPHPLMHGIGERARTRLRTLPRSSADRLTALATPAPTLRVAPDILSVTTVLVDPRDRPRAVIVPGRRATRHMALCVQREDDVREIALRAAARSEEDRFAPICLCDELGRLIGLIGVDTLLQALARSA